MDIRVSAILQQGLKARQQAGNEQAAQRLFREALDLEPTNPDASHLLGVSLFQAGERESGIEFLRRAITHGPLVAGYHMNLGNALADTGQYDEALKAYHSAQVLAPNDPEVQFNIGNTQRRAGRLEEAVSALLKALELRPDFVEAADLLGRTHAELGQVDAAARVYGELIARTGNPGAKVRRALLLPPVADSVEQIDSFRERIAANLDALEAEGVSLRDPLAEVGSTHCYLSYHDRSNRELNSRIADFYVKACPQLGWVAPHVAQKRRCPGKVRVGFISRFFREHSIGKTSHGLIEQLSRDDFTVAALFVPPRVDDRMSRKIAAAADEVHVLPTDLAGAREAIAALELDVLFYQDIGMEPFTYFLAFARLAPVQCVSFGHPDTTGIANMDYFISSALYEPEGAQGDYSEELVTIPDAGTLAYYERPPLVPEVGARAEVGLPDGTHVYLCPQTLFKMHPQFDAIVDGILRRDPLGIVILVAPEINQHLVSLQDRLKRSIGGLIGRVGVVPRRDRREFIRLLKAADVILDTPGFNGMNSSLEALACGVPVVTLAGGLQRGRHTSGMYRRMGYTDCVARDAAHYVDIAVGLATNAQSRESVRQAILARCGRLFEDRDVLHGFEDFFRTAVERVRSGDLPGGPVRDDTRGEAVRGVNGGN